MLTRYICYFIMTVAVSIGLATSSSAQVIEIYRTELSGEAVVPPSGQLGEGEITIYFGNGGPCDFHRDEPAQICFLAWDLSGEAIDLRLGIAPQGENADSLLVLASLDSETEPCFSALVDWPDCDYWTAEEVYVVLTIEAYPEGELRGQFAFVPQPTIEASWGSVKRRWSAILTRQ